MPERLRCSKDCGGLGRMNSCPTLVASVRGGVGHANRCTPQILVTADHSKSVRRMSRSDAEAAAIRLAGNLIASEHDDRWILTIVNASPCAFDPRPVGKTPSRWFVGTRGVLRDSPDTVVDGGDPMIAVDLVADSAEWVDETQL
jgi:hypothetical protein